MLKEVYKLVDENTHGRCLYTRGGFLWNLGKAQFSSGFRRSAIIAGISVASYESQVLHPIKHRPPSARNCLRTCTHDVIHWYTSPTQAELYYTLHVAYRNPKLFVAKPLGLQVIEHDKGGSDGLILTSEFIPMPLEYIGVADFYNLVALDTVWVTLRELLRKIRVYNQTQPPLATDHIIEALYHVSLYRRRTLRNRQFEPYVFNSNKVFNRNYQDTAWRNAGVRREIVDTGSLDITIFDRVFTLGQTTREAVLGNLGLLRGDLALSGLFDCQYIPEFLTKIYRQVDKDLERWRVKCA